MIMSYRLNPSGLDEIIGIAAASSVHRYFTRYMIHFNNLPPQEKTLFFKV